jgi:uncharacterized membrane protein YecN with MAPEG domain
MTVPAWTALATVVVAVEYYAFSGLVALARSRTGIQPPAMTGAPELDRAVRVHLNTLEKLALVLPCAWVAGVMYADRWAAGVVAAWGITRVAYAVGYLREPRLRMYGALAGDICEFALAGMALYGAIRAVIG